MRIWRRNGLGNTDMEMGNTMTEGRIALVTGGNRGIGLATAQCLLTRGYRVAITYRNEAPSEFDHSKNPSTLAMQCDVTNADDIDRAFSEIEATWGPVEVLVPNAGITQDALLMRMTEDNWDAVLDTNLKAPWRCIKRAIGPMSKARFGRVILLSSVVGVMGGPGQANYGASKSGLIGLARSLTREYAARGITFNLVAPGPIETDMLNAVSEAATAKMIEMVPAKRSAKPEEVAAAIAFLASDDASYISGVILPVDGGMAMGT